MSSSAGLSDNGTAGGDKRFDPLVGDIGGEADDEVGADCAGELHVSHRSCGVGQPIPVDDINHGRRSAGHLQCKCVDVLLRPLQRTPCRSRKRRGPCSSLGSLPPAILRSQRSPSHTWALDTASKQLRRTTATTSVQSNHSYRHRNQRRQRTWLVDAVDTPAPGRMFRAIRAAARAVTPTVVAVSIAPSSQFRPSARSVVATPLTFNDADGPRVDQTLVSPAGEMRRFAK